MRRLELPDGAWAELMDPTKVPERKRRPVVKALSDLTASSGALKELDGLDTSKLTDEEKMTAARAAADSDLFELTDVLKDRLILAQVAAWSFGEEVTLEAVGDLPADAYAVLSEACAAGMKAMMPDFGLDEVPPDPKALTSS